MATSINGFMDATADDALARILRHHFFIWQRYVHARRGQIAKVTSPQNQKKQHKQFIQKKLIRKSVTSVANFDKFNKSIRLSIGLSMPALPHLINFSNLHQRLKMATLSNSINNGAGDNATI